MKVLISQLVVAALLLCIYYKPSEALSSGVAVSAKAVATFNEIKLNKKHRYAILVIRDEKEIDVETVGRRDATYADFLKDLQVGGKAECRFGIFDLEHIKCKSLFVISWCPSTAIVRQKVLYASSYLNLKDSLKGIDHIEATELGEASEEAVLQSRICSTKTIH